MIYLISFVLLILIVWFKTDAFVEYCRFFGIEKHFHINEYLEAKKEDLELTYHLYLRMNYDSFFVRLITCPICLTIWIYLPILLIELIVYPVFVLFTLFLYYLFIRLKT